MEYYGNVDGGGSRRAGTIHHKKCWWARPAEKSNPAEFWFGTLTLDAARRIVRALGAEENLHTHCINRETLRPIL